MNPEKKQVKISDNKVYHAVILLVQSKTNPSVRGIAKIMNKEKSLRSIQLSLERIIAKGLLEKDEKGTIRLAGGKKISELQE